VPARSPPAAVVYWGTERSIWSLLSAIPGLFAILLIEFRIANRPRHAASLETSRRCAGRAWAQGTRAYLVAIGLFAPRAHSETFLLLRGLNSV